MSIKWYLQFGLEKGTKTQIKNYTESFVITSPIENHVTNNLNHIKWHLKAQKIECIFALNTL